ncbi:rhomboid family intramembrane serine protease GlpG [Planctomycetales bacterium]|nr:rhomboid family intramembrane serine protease GlpG [Planctomycetales bacterium]
MRLLGRINDDNEALMAQGFLLSRRISCQFEQDRNGWEFWALDENQLPEARGLFQQFLADADKTPYAEFLPQARAAFRQARPASGLAEMQLKKSRGALTALTKPNSTPLTWLILTVCVGLWLLQTLIPATFPYLCDALQITPLGDAGLGAIFERGQIWRLFTPALLHMPVFAPGGGFNFMGLLHIGFNMLWVYDLAPLIERKHGTGYLLALMLTIGVASNLTQYFWAGPNFLGFSGVVYGLLGFLWLRGKTDPRYGVSLNPGVVSFMLIWLGVCVLMTGVANGAHVGGLLVGAAWGYASGAFRRR